MSNASGEVMMNMNCCTGWMMGGMWFLGILLILAVLLGIGALGKYLFSTSEKN